MYRSEPADHRQLRCQAIDCDLAIVGGGLAGVCCAITAARAGLRVALVQDRPVLGGNSSSEVRLWVLGATSHMGNNNRWAREGGVIDEILVENMYRNPEGNPLIFDTILLEQVTAEPNITLLLNTAAYEVGKRDADTIESVVAFCSQNGTQYEIRAALFCDASGDGILGFLAGAAFRMGAESKEEFGEKFAPDAGYGELLGHTIYFYSKDTGRPVKFIPPSFALKDITQIPRWRQFAAKEFGCQLWWIEYGGRLDTIHDSETIKWELWKVVYGVWNHIKNSGQFPEAENLTLEWVGAIPGKRESRRFEGDYMLIQQDIVEQRRHEDAVSFGGWAIDLHPGDGVYSDQPGCTQWHSKGVYQIPYRCMYSRNIANLFLAGRIISASHVAFGSTRVMATCAHNAQAVALAAVMCRRESLLPRDLNEPSRMRTLQRELLKIGQHIPHLSVEDDHDLVRQATIAASSTLRLASLDPSGEFMPLSQPVAMLLPLQAGPVPKITFHARSAAPANLVVQLRACSREDSHTPDEVLESVVVEMGEVARRDVAMTAGYSDEATKRRSDEGPSPRPSPGVPGEGEGALQHSAFSIQNSSLSFGTILETPRYVMVCFMPAEGVSIALSDRRITGILSLSHCMNKKVAKSAIQSPPLDIGVETFEFWMPQRRPANRNIAMRFDPPLGGFEVQNIARGPERPTGQANAWIADLADPRPAVELSWPAQRKLGRITLCLDTDFDHPMESVLMGHPERIMPFTARNIRLRDGKGKLLAEILDNHQTRPSIDLGGISADQLRIEFEPLDSGIPIAVFRVRIEPGDADATAAASTFV